ncbi:hypothetical protein, partial [Escherichia coli]|uniref:hypothetical protein n=1 Tax=Escherichia coli TaxID=562 RepID=UPI001CDAF1C4
LMKTLLTSGCTNQRGAGQIAYIFTMMQALCPPLLLEVILQLGLLNHHILAIAQFLFLPLVDALV